MSSCLAGDKEFAEKLLIQDNWEVINPKTLGKWVSGKVSQIIFPNPTKPGLQGHCFLMYNKKTN